MPQTPFAFLSSLGLGFVFLGLGAAELKTPETSRLFDRHVDSETGVVSWILRPKTFAWNQQSIYFTAKSMTDDGRYLVFDCSDDEFKTNAKGKLLPARKRKAVVDFLTDEIYALPGTDGSIPFLDPETAKMYCTGPEGVWMNDLRADPTNRVLVCPWPKEFLALGRKRGFLATHPTMNPSRTRMFVETRFDDTFYHGCLNLKTKTWEHWGSTPFFLNHGQICPTDENLAMGAWEVDWVDSKGEHHPIHKVGDDQRYPRMWYLEPGNRQRMIDPGPANYATHEMWDADGRGHYWNSGMGLWHYDRFSGKTERISPFPSGHTSVSADNRYVVTDFPVSTIGWRGHPWSVVFYDRTTGAAVFIHALTEALCPREKGSRLHPDPHPALVCRERYVVTTVNRADGHMDLCLTPTAPLKARCAKPTPLGLPLPAAAHPVDVGMRIFQRYIRVKTAERLAHGGSKALREEMATYARLTANHRIGIDCVRIADAKPPRHAEDPDAVAARNLIARLVSGDTGVRAAARKAWLKVTSAAVPEDWLNVLATANLLLAADMKNVR